MKGGRTIKDKNSLSITKRAWLCAGIFTVFPMLASADGDLDTSFGNNGVVKIDFPNSSRGYLRAVAVVNGVLEAAGFEREKVQLGSISPGCSSSFPNLFIVKMSLGGEVMVPPSS